MRKTIERLLFNSDIDLGLSTTLRESPAILTVRSKIGPPRIALGLLFGIPCAVLLLTAMRYHGIYLLLPVVFCPPMAILAVLFGLSVQEKSFDLQTREAVRGFRIPGMARSQSIRLQERGTVVTWKEWSSGDSGGCFVYHAEIRDLEGFGFTVSRDEERRNDFARELAEFLDYGLQDLGETRNSR